MEFSWNERRVKREFEDGRKLERELREMGNDGLGNGMECACLGLREKHGGGTSLWAFPMPLISFFLLQPYAGKILAQFL